jgi:hypothetical protein
MSEQVYNVVQIGTQSGSTASPGAAAAATFLYPISDKINPDLELGSAYPTLHRGRNVRNLGGSGYHGVRKAGVTLPSEVRFEDIMPILEMCYAGGIVPSGSYTWLYPFEAGAPTIVPATLETGNIDIASAQERLVSSLINSLTLGFSPITAGQASPWTLSADMMAFDREVNALTVSGAGTNEIQAIAISASSGTWIASFMGQATSPVNFDVSTADLQTALRALSTINGANVTVGGSPGAYTVTFIGSLAKTNVAMITTNAAGLGGTGTHTATVTQSTPGAAAANMSPIADPLETVQGHLTRFYEGTTSTAFGSLSESAATLRSFTMTASRNLALRAYGSASDQASKFGFTDLSNATYEMLVAVNATTKTDLHDTWNTSGASIGERRIRIQASGTASKKFTVDARAGLFAIPWDDSDGERVYKVSGEFADDTTLGASHTIEVVNSIAAIP